MRAEQLADLAASVADGTAVDWNAAELRGTIAERRLIGHLRLVESIANLHKSVPADRPLADLASSVADGAPVDWRAAEAQISPAERRFLRHLRIVENISTIHRTTRDDDSQGTAAVADPKGPRWGRLVLLDRIGEGMSCEVYRAWDTELHRHVALKLLHDEGNRRDAHTRILEEARRLARVRHSHVVQVYGAEQHDNRVGLWMELVQGESLEHILHARGPFGPREAAAIGLDLCAALAAVHRAHLLHRDIKAHNVMRENGGRIVLMDFGTGEELTGTNRLVGTPLYLAPEIFQGQPASVQSDLYSVGVLLFYLVTRRYPVSASSMEMLARAHELRQRQTLRDLRPDLPESFVGAVERALHSDPQRRYRTAGEMEAALRSADTAPAPVRAVEAVVPRDVRRRVRMDVVAVAAVLALVVAGLIVWGQWIQSRRGAVLSSIRTIAVLPMETLPGVNAPPQGLGEGLTDELISTLGQLHALTVKSGLGVKDRGNRTEQEIAKSLDVDALLLTTLSSTPGDGSGKPGRFTIRARLVAAGTGGIVWTQPFERSHGEATGLQADIAKAIAQEVKAAVTPQESARLADARQTNPAAEEAYLVGRTHLDRHGAVNGDLALKAFQRTLRLDARHAPAYDGSARARLVLGLSGAISQQRARAEALADVHRALEIDADLAEAHATLGFINFVYDWNWRQAEQSFRRSLELNPSSVYARTYYAEHLAALGRFDDGVKEAELAKSLDPESAAAARRYALVLYYKRDYPGAERALADALRLEPNAEQAALLQNRIDEAVGRFAQALEATRRAAQLSGGDHVGLRVNIVRLEALNGRRDEARAELRALQDEAAAGALRLSSRDLAYVQLAFGHHDAALELLSAAVEERDPSIVWIGVDQRLDPLRGDARFQRILKRIGLPSGP